MSYTDPPKGHEAFGVMAEFSTVGDLVKAIESVRKAGYSKLDAYTPFPSEEVEHALHLSPSILPYIVFGAGCTGGTLGYLMQYWMLAVDYPVNIGGRPLNSWAYFIPITFEATVLFAAFTAAFGMILLNGLPMPYHPVFNWDRFASATSDKFFLAVMAEDPKYNRTEIEQVLSGLGAVSTSEVER